MKKEKKQRLLKIFIVALSLLLIILTIVITINDKSGNSLKDYPCTKKGQICSAKDINKGILLEIKVKNNKTMNFYMISNDANEMTLIAEKNIASNTSWHTEDINMKGPTSALSTVFTKTKYWSNISPIEDYTYEDYGYKNFIQSCTNDLVEPNYECNTNGTSGRGYLSLSIDNNKVGFEYNLPVYDDEEGTPSKGYHYETVARARLITLEEINLLSDGTSLPSWLISNLKENEGYWTSTSSTAMNVQYTSGALAIANKDNLTSVESLFVMAKDNENYKIGIRPVITIKKQ